MEPTASGEGLVLEGGFVEVVYGLRGLGSTRNLREGFVELVGVGELWLEAVSTDGVGGDDAVVAVFHHVGEGGDGIDLILRNAVGVEETGKVSVRVEGVGGVAF